MDNPKKVISLFKWIWYSFLKTALIPLILVELVFIGIYFLTNSWSQLETVGYLKEEVTDELDKLAVEKSDNIQQQLKSISYSTELLVRQYQSALQNQADFKTEDAQRLIYSPEGVYYTSVDKPSGGAAIFYSGIYPIGELEREKVARLLTTENIMKDVVETQPLAAQVYLNTYDSLNIIYPYFDVISQYAPKMDIPSFNFYYEADLAHNPEKTVKWTDSYLDPAGMGWMASATMPVYNEEFLEGVVGIDITISTITEQVLNMEIPWGGYGVLVGKDGTILALPEKGEEDWGLNELTSFNYIEAIQEDTFKPEQFNIYLRSELSEISDRLKSENHGHIELEFNNENKVISWSTIEETGWKLLIIIPEENIFTKVNDMKELLFKIGTLMIIGLFSFYVIFFYVLSRKSRKMSLNISKPLISINEMVKKIGKGDYYHEVTGIKVEELLDTAQNLSAMGYALGKSNEELMTTQSELEKSESDLRALVNAIDDVVLVSDEEGNINKVWNMKQDVLSNEDSKDKFLNKVSGEIENSIKRIAKTRKTESIEFQIETENGVKWLQARMSLIEGDQEKIVISARDITDRKELEESLIIAKEEAEKASLSKSQFLSSMSHELRTPLNAVIGFSQILQIDPEHPLTEDQDESVNEILKAGKHLLSLINEVLDLSRIESGKMSMSIENVLVGDIIAETVALVSPMADQYNIKLHVDSTKCRDKYVETDLTRIKQVLLNLLSNSIKYNKENGSVDFYCEDKGDKIRFNVIDTGIGISEDDIKSIYKPFQRLNFNHSEIEGTGIGLTVAKQLVELMSGEIGMESELNKGSHFYVDIPISKMINIHEVGELTHHHSEEKTGNEFKILYVEDNPANMNLVEKIIKSIPDTQFYPAVLGEISIELARAHKPNLILLDMNLPGIDGYEVFKRLKQYKETKNIPIIALSANAMPNDIKRALGLGFDDYLTKPLNVSAFIEKINEMKNKD